MGRTSSLRDYMADIARSNAEGGSGGGGGETIDVSYFYNKANIASIALFGLEGKENAIESFEINENTTSITPTTVDKSTIFGVRITYKNNLMFGNDSNDDNFIIIKTMEYNNENFEIGGYKIELSTNKKIVCGYTTPG
jgi:hypothetical protein